MIDKFEKLGAEAKFLSPEEFAAFIADENRRMTDIVRAAGVKGN
jgi:tripartite-type tricarboxylate transporter receptor subunit TctC